MTDNQNNDPSPADPPQPVPPTEPSKPAPPKPHETGAPVNKAAPSPAAKTSPAPVGVPATSHAAKTEPSPAAKTDAVAPSPGDAPTDAPTPSPSAGTVSGTIRHYAAKLIRIVPLILMPLVWVLRPLVFRISHEPGSPKVSFTSFSTLIYLWPIMVVGWLGAWASTWEWIVISPVVLGWIWITVLFLVLISMGADIDRNKLLVLLGVIALLWLSGALINARMDIPVLSNVHDYFARLDVRFEPGTARVLSIATLITLCVVVLGAWFDGRYEITSREITHRRLLRTSDSLPRAAKRIKRDWRDMAEFLLGIGAGDLIVIDTQKNVVLRISNVPFLWFFRHDVDHILEVLATTDVADIAAAEEEEFG